MYNVLLLEDDRDIRELISDYLDQKAAGDICLTVAADGKEFYKHMADKEYALLLLDVMLPDTDGFEICRKVREKSNVPIIFLTAKNNIEDILCGYGLGCDDYMVKPFRLAELLAKMRAILKRNNNTFGGELLKLGDVEMDRRCMKVYVNGNEVRLQNKQYELLRVLMENPNEVFNRSRLLDKVWGYDYEGTDRAVDNQIKKLRHSLGSAGGQIKTVIGQGYRMEGKA